jgi:hypothetical protein
MRPQRLVPNDNVARAHRAHTGRVGRAEVEFGALVKRAVGKARVTRREVDVGLCSTNVRGVHPERPEDARAHSIGVRHLGRGLDRTAEQPIIDVCVIPLGCRGTNRRIGIQVRVNLANRAVPRERTNDSERQVAARNFGRTLQAADHRAQLR